MPADLATLSALKARVEAATGPDRRMDDHVHDALNQTAILALPYTAKTDAALALLERVLPGWDWEMYRTTRHRSGERYTVILEWPEGAITQRQARTPPRGDSTTLPLAILSALLTAKIAQLEVDHAR